MREIKFRAWDKEFTKMRVIGFSVNKGILSNDETCIIMQYTGLKDVHGKEIYEGDIVKEGKENQPIWDDAIILKPPIGVVYYCTELALWNVEMKIKGTYQYTKTKEIYDNLHMNTYDGLYMWNEENDLEIIGNIYENPELLTKVR